MIEQCVGCEYCRSEENASKELAPSLCRVYMYPENQHTRVGGCAMRTHNKVMSKSDEFKLNPLKASKRGIKQ
jgi:hypothetical protein